MASGDSYEPFAHGPHRVIAESFSADDTARGHRFPIETWTPETAAPAPLVLYSHSSGGNRHSSSFLFDHLASHGYAVAALDHSELVAPALRRRDGETPEERAARVRSIIAARVPDLRFLLATMLGRAGDRLDSERTGAVGHSFGGWTVLAAPEVEARIRSVVALAPGGSDHPRPGIIPSKLTFEWRHPVPVLILAAEDDVPVPLDNVREVYERARGPKRMFVLRAADHQHLVDDVEGEHEGLRGASLPGDGAWIPPAMRPIGELMPAEHAHRIVRGLALAHLDATLRGSEAAERFLAQAGASEHEFVYPA